MKIASNQRKIDNLQWKFQNENLIILESQMPEHPSSVQSFVAVRPKNQIKISDNRVEWQIDGQKKSFSMNPWQALSEFRNQTGGWLFGYLGYDLKNHTENLTSENRELLAIPDLYFMEPELLFRIEKENLVQLSGDNISSAESQQNFDINEEIDLQNFEPSISWQRYKKNILHIQELIKNGNFYELNYSFPMCGQFSGTSYRLYQKMRQINPVPFGAYLSLDEYSVVCASPERFLKKQGAKVISEPIKGTAARNENKTRDIRQKEELLNEKNRAENLMIVDLVRHDLSKIAKIGSVKVAKLYDVQTFGTVHQLISTIEAETDDQVNPVEILKQCFPMGSMTGAPKIEVMKTIDQLEEYRRALYSGAIGYITPEGNFDFNVVIRTAIIQGNQLIYPVGGAITSDSESENEWKEAEVKARSITNVFKKSGE